MKFMETLTRLVIGMSRFGDHLLKQKFIGIIFAALAFACGAGLAHALKGGPRTPCAAVVQVTPADPSRAEVVMRDTRAEVDENEDAVFEGRYENYVYGYSVEIPAGMVGLGAPPPAPQHGFGIDLDHPRSTAWIHSPEFPKSYVYVDGSYNSLEWERLLDDAVNSNLNFLREKGRNVRMRVQEETRLGALPAVRAVTDYEQDGVEMVSDQVVAFGEGASIVYTLGLSTPRSRYGRDKPVLEALMKGWCLQPAE